MTLDFTQPQKPVSALFLFRTYRAFQLLGARRPVLLKAMKLEEPELRNPVGCFESTRLTALVDASAEELNTSDLLSKTAKKMVPFGFSDPGFLAMFETRFGTVLEKAIRSQRLGGDKAVFGLSRGRLGDYVTWERAACPTREIMCLGFAVIIESLLSIEQDVLCHIRNISFVHSRPENSRENSIMAGDNGSVPVLYDRPHNRIEFRRGFFDLANPQCNMRLKLASEEQRSDKRWQNRPYAKSCYDYLTYLLDKPGPNLDSAADTFAVAERTLRRKLVAEGTSFRQVLEWVRRDICHLYFLEGKRQLSDISTLLGYSELSAFTRAYTGWYGHPPSKDASVHAKLAA
ncbi:MAG: helix-turn-helix domain-containing protein [Pseudomonadota bacterium]